MPGFVDPVSPLLRARESPESPWLSTGEFE
jgi:hypothetical protein